MSSVENQESTISVSKDSSVATEQNMVNGAVASVNDPVDLTRTNVENCDKIRETDRDDETGATLYCYINCSDNDSDFVKKCRGLVFHGDNLVFKGFGYTPEFIHDQVQQIQETVGDFSKWTAYDAYEGAILRLFHFSGRWYLSTNRKLNAFRSKWASRKSFGTMFKEALVAETEENKEFLNKLPQGDNILDQFEETLDKNKQYMFLLCNSAENRIVCLAPERSRIYHVGTFVDGNLHMDVDCGIPYPTKRNFTSVEDMCKQIDTNVDPTYTQGLCLFGPDNRQFKVLHTEYQRLFKVRGNVPSIKFRYLEIRMHKEMVRELYQLYPNFADTFDDYESTLYEIAQEIYRAYVRRFIKKEHITVPIQEYAVIRECHGWHLTDREKNRVNLEKIITVLNKQPPSNLNRMIQRFYNERKKKLDCPARMIRGSRDNSPMINGRNSGNAPTVLNIPPPQLV